MAESNKEFLKRAERYIKKTPFSKNWGEFQKFVLEIGKQQREALNRLSFACDRLEKQQAKIKRLKEGNGKLRAAAVRKVLMKDKSVTGKC